MSTGFLFFSLFFCHISITTQRQYFGLPRISLPVLGWILCRIVSGRSQCYLDRQMDGRSSATHLLGTWATAKILGYFDFFFGFGTPLILNDQKPAKLVIQSMYKHIWIFFKTVLFIVSFTSDLCEFTVYKWYIEIDKWHHNTLDFKIQNTLAWTHVHLFY